MTKEEGKKTNRILVEEFFKIAKDGDILLECGARGAETSIRFKKENPYSRVIAFEANPITYSKSTIKAKEHGVEIYNIGITDKCGTMPFRIPLKKETAGNASFMKRSKERMHRTVDVQVKNIDSLDLKEENIILWIDVEGMGYEVLVGAENTLENTSVVFIEVEEHPYWVGQKLADDVDLFLKSKGFSFYKKDQEYSMQHNRIYIK